VFKPFAEMKFPQFLPPVRRLGFHVDVPNEPYETVTLP